MSFVFKEGERVDKCDGAIDEVEGCFIIDKEMKVCDKERRRSCFKSDVCACRNWVRTKIYKINCDFKFESKIRSV